MPQPTAKLKTPDDRYCFEQSFASIRPYLYHLTAASNVCRIRREQRLVCAAELLAAGGRTDLLRKKRGKDGCRVRVGNDDVHVRDQEPLYKGNMDLLCGWSFGHFIEHLNRFVFFWPGKRDGGLCGPGQRHFCRYAHERPMLIRIPTPDLFAKNCVASPRFCSYNSGAPRWAKGKPSPRGPRTFSYGDQYDRTRKVVEVVYEAAALLPKMAQISCSPRGPWRSLNG